MTDPKPLRVGQRVRHKFRPWVFGGLICFDEDGERALVSGHGWYDRNDLERLPDDAATRGGGEGSE